MDTQLYLGGAVAIGTLIGITALTSWTANQISKSKCRNTSLHCTSAYTVNVAIAVLCALFAAGLIALFAFTAMG